jgi:hypothetical protein
MNGSHSDRWFLWLALLGGLWAAPLSAQSLTHGSLAGTIVREGAPVGETPVRLSDVSVRASDVTTGITWSVQTERGGDFRLFFLPPGEYSVLVERLGYRPKRIEGVRIRAGSRTELNASLEPTPPPVEHVDVVAWDGAHSAARPGVVQAFSAQRLDALPESRREVSEVGRLFSESNARLETEGLPGRFTALVVDGIPFSSAWHPDVPSASLRAAAFPLSAFSEVELVTEAADVELSGWAGGYMRGATRGGTREFSARASGTWAGEPLTWSSHFDPSAQPYAALQGWAQVGGPIVPDTAAFLVGIEARRLEAAFPRAWVPTTMDEDLIRVARDRFGVDLQRYAEPRLLQSEALTASGRFDWQIGQASALQVRGSLATVPSADLDATSPGAGFGAIMEGRDLAGAATLTTEFDRRRAMEVRVSYERSLRAYDLEEGLSVPNTRLVLGGFAVGGDAGLPGRFEHSALRLSQTLHIRTGRHHFKAGLAGAWSSYDHTYAYGRAGEFTFADAAAFEAGRGAFVQAIGALPVTRFNVPRYGIFAQNLWRAAPGLEVTAGLRYDAEWWPDDQVQLNALWLERTGIDNTEMERLHRQVSPRLALSWDIQQQQRWRVDVAAGIHYQAADPTLLGEVLTHDGRVEIRRGLGDLGNWPAPPSATAAPVMGPRLTLLGPNFESPRTSRATGGITHQLDEHTAVTLSGTVRRTEFLPRRVDLNRLPSPIGADQYGRPIYGQLVKDGRLLMVEPGSNRRFTDFDMVSAITADGTSEYLGFTMAVDRWAAGVFGFFGSYTYSQTTDDWPAAGSGGPAAQLRPFPDAPAATDWSQGRSDYDIPHRLVVAGELRLPAPLQPRIAGVFRVRSGDPFTPGFRDGIDASGDGSGHNDPAFVDEGIPGVSELIAQWDCLRLQAGRFAERNACRGPAVQSLDMRLALQVVTAGRYSAELVVDGLNLVESAVGIRDRALFLVDPDRDLIVDPVSGAVDVPLLANPGFGELLARHSTGRVLRLGFRLTY